MSGKQITNRDPQREAAFYQFMSDNGIRDSNQGLVLFLDAERKAQAKAQAAQPPAQKPGFSPWRAGAR